MKISRRDIQLALMSQAPSGHPLREPIITKARRKNQKPEEALQIALCQWLDTQPSILYWANDKQVILGKMTPQKLGYLAKKKKMGSRKGIPDLSLLFRNKHGASVFAFAELKDPNGGRVSDEQQACMEACNQRGGYSAVVRSLQDLQRLLNAGGY